MTHQAFAGFSDYFGPVVVHGPAGRQLQETCIVAASDHTEPIAVAHILHVQKKQTKE